MRKYIEIVAFFVFLLLAFSCEEPSFNLDVDCDECYTEKPDSSDLVVRLTFNDLNDSIPLVFYRGKIEDGTVEWVDTATVQKYPDGKYYLYSPVNEYYSVKAEYVSGKYGKVIAVDGDKMKTRHVTDVCDTDCYIVKGGKLDVRLKYE